MPRYEGWDNWNNLPGKIATHQKTGSVTRSVDQHRFGLLGNHRQNSRLIG
jgi:hypothetical protein